MTVIFVSAAACFVAGMILDTITLSRIP